MFKQIISWIIAIIVGLVVMRVVLWLFSAIMHGLIWLLLIAAAVIVAYPLQKFLKEKIF